MLISLGTVKGHSTIYIYHHKHKFHQVLYKKLDRNIDQNNLEANHKKEMDW